MTLETYVKTEVYLNPDTTQMNLALDMNKGIRNFKLFFALYGHDRRVHLRSNTYGVDRRKRYVIPFKNMIGTKIHIIDLEYSLFNRWPKSFEKLKSQIDISKL